MVIPAFKTKAKTTAATQLRCKLIVDDKTVEQDRCAKECQPCEGGDNKAISYQENKYTGKLENET